MVNDGDGDGDGDDYDNRDALKVGRFPGLLCRYSISVDTNMNMSMSMNMVWYGSEHRSM